MYLSELEEIKLMGYNNRIYNAASILEIRYS